MYILTLACLLAMILVTVGKLRTWSAKRRSFVRESARRHRLIGQAAAAAVEALEIELLSSAQQPAAKTGPGAP